MQPDKKCDQDCTEDHSAGLELKLRLADSQSGSLSAWVLRKALQISPILLLTKLKLFSNTTKWLSEPNTRHLLTILVSLNPWRKKIISFHLSVAPTEFIAAGRLIGLWKKIQRTRNLAALLGDERSPDISWKRRTLSQCPSPNVPFSTIMLSSVAHMDAVFPDQRCLCFSDWWHDSAFPERHNPLV